MKNYGILQDCLSKYDSFYLYDETSITESADQLKYNFPQVQFLYSIKCNSNPLVLRSIFSQGFGADVASAGEVFLARDAGLKAGEVYYSAPGKSIIDIERTIDHAVIIADSLNEIERIQIVAARMNLAVKIGIRINPEFTFSEDSGSASKFGIDEEQAESFIKDNPYKNIQVAGIHVHLKSQELSVDTLAAYYHRMFELSEKFDNLCGGLEFINMGSGMGIPYSQADTELNVNLLGELFQKEASEYNKLHPDTHLMIETGRYVAGKCGIYVTRVMDRKVSHGKTYLILKNTLNGFLRPPLAKLIGSYSAEESPKGTEPLFTSKDAFEILPFKSGEATDKVTLAGNLCTNADVVAEDILMPHMECGDAVIITNAGSYAAVLSPFQFSSHDRPAELFLSRNGEIVQSGSIRPKI